MKDWIVTRISVNRVSNNKEFPLQIEGINLNNSGRSYGETERYFTWRVTDVFDERYDIGKAVIDDDVPLMYLQTCRKNG